MRSSDWETKYQITIMYNCSPSYISQLSLNGNNVWLWIYIHCDIVNVVRVIDECERIFKTYSILCLEMYIEKWTTRQLEYIWHTYRCSVYCALLILSFSGECPSIFNHWVLLIRKCWPWRLCEYNCLHEHFHYITSSLLVLEYIQISTCHGLLNILDSTRLG